MKNLWRKEAAAGTGTGPAALAQGDKNEGRAPNPYLDSRRAWNSHVDRAYAAQHTWQLLCVVCLLIRIWCYWRDDLYREQKQVRPVRHRGKQIGETVSVGPAHVAGAADPRVVRASLASFIASARLVTPDVTLQREAIFRVYAMLHTKDPAAQQMNEWYNGSKDSSPFVRASKLTVTTDINSVLPISGNAWQVDWQETTRDRTGALVGQPVHMRAMLTVYLEPVSVTGDEAAIQRNPLGIYVNNFTWQEVL